MMIKNAGDRIMNTWLYPIGDGWVMVDTGYENSYRKVLKRLDNLLIKSGDVRFIFLTHAHDDHAGFLESWMTDHPQTRVIAHEGAIGGLRRGQNSFDGGCSTLFAFLFCRLMALLGNRAHRYPGLTEEHLSKIVTLDEDVLPEVERTLQGKILFTPGHTADHISLLVDGNLFCGDAAMNGIPSSHRITIWVEDKNAFEGSWERILASGAKKICPAHGAPFEPEELARNKKRIQSIRLYPLKHK